MESTNLDWIEPSLTKFVARFESCFRSKPSRGHLANYLRGQTSQLQRKSIEPMALDIALKPRTLQQFISSYVWDQEAMRQGVRHIVATEHAGPNAIAIIDETSFNKKGKKTVGVKRQWCGHTGKIDNCVQTVHLTYVSRDFSTIVDSDLYLPKEWAEDIERRAEARVPEEIKFRTKWEIALEMLERSKSEGLSMRWVTADEFYGRASKFLSGVDALGMLYIVEIPINTVGWTNRGYSRKQEHRRVDELFQRGGPSWIDFYVKDTTKGPVVWQVRATRFVLHAGEDRREKWLLIARNPLDGKVKYFLSNAPSDVEISTLIFVAFTRWRIEHSFEESKQEVGIDHFEVRLYPSLDRHLAISMVSMLFLVQCSLRLRKETSDHWTVPQTKLVVNAIADQELLPETRRRQLDRDLYKIAYWQKRAKVAEDCHRRRRLKGLEAKAVNLAHAEKCPQWIGSS